MNFSCSSFVMKIPWRPPGGGHRANNNPLVSLLLILLLIVANSSCDNSKVKAELSPRFFAETKASSSCPGLEPETFENQVPMGRLGLGNSSLMTYKKVGVSSAGECVQKCCEEGGEGAGSVEKCNMVFMFVNNTSLNCYLVRFFCYLT